MYLAQLLYIQLIIIAQLSSAIVENEGSLSRALFKLAHFASAGVPAVAIPQKENVNFLITHDDVDCACDTYQAYCPICMNDDETILYAPCGHAACRMDWVGLVQVALQDSSTTKVKKGEDGLLDVSRLQCHGCTCVPTVQLTESVYLTSSAQLLIGPHGSLPLTFFHSSRVPFCHATDCRLPLQGDPSIHKLNYNSPTQPEYYKRCIVSNSKLNAAASHVTCRTLRRNTCALRCPPPSASAAPSSLATRRKTSTLVCAVEQAPSAT
jgi:hypothetical protein